MERVLNQSWQWVRAWVPPGLTALALAASMIGLWFVMMNPDQSLFTRTEANAPTRNERASSPATFRQASSARAQSSTSAASGATLAHATPASECEAIRKEIDSVTVRVRGAGKSKQGIRFRSRLRELKELYGEECRPDPGAAP
jgi:hypothetical protein